MKCPNPKCDRPVGLVPTSMKAGALVQHKPCGSILIILDLPFPKLQLRLATPEEIANAQAACDAAVALERAKK